MSSFKPLVSSVCPSIIVPHGNISVLTGETGNITKTGHFNMYNNGTYTDVTGNLTTRKVLLDDLNDGLFILQKWSLSLNFWRASSKALLCWSHPGTSRHHSKCFSFCDHRNVIMVLISWTKHTVCFYSESQGGSVEDMCQQSSFKALSYIWISKTERCFSLCVNSLNDEAKQLMADLGSSAVHSLGFRDNWLFVGGKGATVKSDFEKVTTTTSSQTHNTHELF